MNPNAWTTIPGRLKAAGFNVFFERISYEPERPLWCARASRGEREWSTLGRDLRGAIEELERQTQEAGRDWREIVPADKPGRTAERHPSATN